MKQPCDLVVGFKVNNLTFINRFKSEGKQLALVLCDCGVEKICSFHDFKKGKILSCGCARLESNRSRTLELGGRVFNYLTVLSKSKTSGSWDCLCKCGKTTSVRVAHLMNGNTKSCGCLQRVACKLDMEAKHKQRRIYLGLPEGFNLTPQDNIERAKFQRVRLAILRKDDYQCVWCLKNKNLVVHHIQPWFSHKHLRFDKSNLVTLCRGCHLKAHNGNFLGEVEPVMKIILQGYTAVRVELTPEETLL